MEKKPEFPAYGCGRENKPVYALKHLIAAMECNGALENCQERGA
jgi:hypothetical protein